MDVNTERVYKEWLALTAVTGLGAVGCNKLLLEFKNPNAILNSDDRTLRAFGLSNEIIKSLKNPDLKKIDSALAWLELSNHHLITILDEDYPKLLKAIHAPPVVLFAIGQRAALNNVHFAMVGSRNPSTSGKQLAEDFAYELSRFGLTICSGLALGIDYQSHCGALRANGATIAVLGNGLNTIYPTRHKKIAAQVIEDGLLLSEFLPDVAPMAQHFPQRNRIISGLSVGVLVVEAAKKSGSLITANYALEQGRDVFAIPGSIHNPLARGTHSLIKQGAKLVETIDDIMTELLPLINATLKKDQSFSADNAAQGSAEKSHLDAEYKHLLDCMGYDPVAVDCLVESSGLTAEAVSSMLLILELEGFVESHHGGKYSRCS